MVDAAFCVLHALQARVLPPCPCPLFSSSAAVIQAPGKRAELHFAGRDALLSFIKL